MIAQAKSRVNDNGHAQVSVHTAVLVGKDAAKYLALSYKTLRHLAKHERRVPYIQYGSAENSPLYFRISDLDKFIEANAVPAVRM